LIALRGAIEIDGKPFLRMVQGSDVRDFFLETDYEALNIIIRRVIQANKGSPVKVSVQL
jgi:hypothetical protein